LDLEPDYLVPTEKVVAASAQISAWWRERWLRNRIDSEAVLADVERHTLVRPVQHGARVSILRDKLQTALFAEPP
jgi:hypothetical protein